MLKPRRAWVWQPRYSDPRDWDRRTPLWDGMPEIVNFYTDLNDNKLRKFLKAQHGRILDLGCGAGRFISYADVGIDFSRGMVERAKGKGRSLILASVLWLPFRDKSFYVAFTVDVLFFLNPINRKQFIEEAKRVSKKAYFIEAPRTAFPNIFLSLNERFKPYFYLPFVIPLSFLMAFPIDRMRRNVIPFENYF